MIDNDKYESIYADLLQPESQQKTLESLNNNELEGILEEVDICNKG